MLQSTIISYSEWLQFCCLILLSITIATDCHVGCYTADNKPIHPNCSPNQLSRPVVAVNSGLHFRSNICIFCDHAFSVSGKNFLLVELHGPEYAGVRKLRAHCVSVVFAKHSFHENPWNAHCSVWQSENISMETTICMIRRRCASNGTTVNVIVHTQC